MIKDRGEWWPDFRSIHFRWNIVDFGSGMANKLIGLLTGIPWVKKRINPDELKLLAFDGIYCEPGYEDMLYELMEGVLERTGSYVAMLMMDMNSAPPIFRDHQKLGLLHKLLGTFTADIRVTIYQYARENQPAIPGPSHLYSHLRQFLEHDH